MQLEQLSGLRALVRWRHRLEQGEGDIPSSGVGEHHWGAAPESSRDSSGCSQELDKGPSGTLDAW